MLTERITCILSLTVRTGFRNNEITLLEGTSGEMCLNTVGEVSSDTLIDITHVEGTDGKAFCVANLKNTSTTDKWSMSVGLLLFLVERDYTMFVHVERICRVYETSFFRFYIFHCRFNFEYPASDSYYW